MFNRPDEIRTYVDYLEEFINAAVDVRVHPSTEHAAKLNRKREAFEQYLTELSGLTEKPEPEEYKCPDCGSAMKERTNRQNGNKFYGCVKYPNCLGTRDENGLSKAEREEKKYEEEQTAQQDGFSFNRGKRDPVTEVSPSVDTGWVNPFAKK